MSSSANGPPFSVRVLVASSHNTAGAVPSCGGFACVACGFKRAAEGKIVRCDVAQIACRGKSLKNEVRPNMADQPAGHARHEPPQRSSDAAALRIAQERRHAG